MPQARPMYLVPVSLVCLAIGALAISVPLVLTQPRAEVRTTVPSTPPRYPHVERIMELATHFANTGYSYASGGRLLSEKMPGAIAGVVHLTPPTPTDCEVEWRLNCGEVDADSPRSFLKVKQHEVREYSDAFWQCLKHEWNSAADHVPELQGGIHLISRAAAVHAVALQYQDVEHAQVRKALEKVPQRVAECEFVNDGSSEQFRLTLEDTCGNYYFMLELYDTQNASDGPWRRAVLYFDHLAESALMKSDGRASGSPSYTGIDPFP